MTRAYSLKGYGGYTHLPTGTGTTKSQVGKIGRKMERPVQPGKANIEKMCEIHDPRVRSSGVRVERYLSYFV